MKHIVRTQKAVRGEDHLLENVFAIIDSRIQYIEYQNRKIFDGCVDEKEKPITRLSMPFLNESKRLVNNFEYLLEQISRSSRSMKLLLFLRTRLIRENARVVLDLLTNSQYLDYSEDRLQQILSIEH